MSPAGDVAAHKKASVLATNVVFAAKSPLGDVAGGFIEYKNLILKNQEPYYIF